MPTTTFIGFDNYLANYDGEWLGLLTDPAWWHAVWNTVWFTLVSVSIETVLGIVVALVLNAEFPGRGLVRAAILIPWAIPTIVSAKHVELDAARPVRRHQRHAAAPRR